MDYREEEERMFVSKSVAIEDGFTCYDKIFYQWDDKNNADLLLLVSTEKQLIESFDLMGRQWSTLSLGTENSYRNIEIYDKKIFCVDTETFSLDILFLTRKQRAYHKRHITFANKGIRLKEKAHLVVWKHHEAGVIYRCLLGPSEDGRYMNFDLLERYFTSRTDEKTVIGNVVFISLDFRDGNMNLDDVICAVDGVRKSIICYNERTHKFFEYNDFAGEESRFLNTMENIEKGMHVNRIYPFCPYDFFPQSRKNQLQASAKNIGRKEDLDAFVRNLHREVLVCMKEGRLLKLALMQEAVMVDDNLWKATLIELGSSSLTDIAINDRTGEIYCLCKEEIQILERQEKNPSVMLKVEMRKRQLLSDNYSS